MFVWRGNDPDFAQKKIRKILEDKICQQFQKTPKKVEGGLSGS
jgi:hypothetical protein